MSTVASGGRMLSLTPVSRCLSTPNTSPSWRPYKSAVSSPEFSDSKDEEDMEIDSDEHSPRVGAMVHLPSRSLTLSSLSDLRISGHGSTSLPGCGQMATFGRTHSFQIESSGQTLQCAPSSGAPNDLDEADCCFADATQTLSSKLKRERVSLAPYDISSNGQVESRKTLKSDNLSEKQNIPPSSRRSGWFYVVLLSIAVAICASFCYRHSLLATFPCVEQFDVASLHRQLNRRVHGQHIAVNVVTQKMDEFLLQSDSGLLVMSFHGWTGIGKNFLSTIISQQLPRGNIHKLIVPLHFAHGTHEESLLLSESITSNLTAPSCGLHLFIIDEVDKASSAIVHTLVNTLSQLVESTEMHGRAVVLLLTNDGAIQINSIVAGALMNGGSREYLGVDDFILQVTSEWYVELTSANLIHQAVPFLPLERHHVVQCAEAELSQRHVDAIDRQLIDKVVSSVLYFPTEFPLFSRSGCRRISHLVDLFL